jgi:hypothetical protein
MEPHPDRDLALRQALRRRGDRLAIKGNRGHHVTLARPKSLQELPPVTVAFAALYQARKRRPASAPTPMQMSVASGYQVATNSGESSGQCEA